MIDRVMALLSEKKYQDVKRTIATMHEADVAEIFEEIEDREVMLRLFRLLPKEQAADLLTLKDGQTESVRVDMGAPELDGLSIPSLIPGKPVIGHPLTANGRDYRVTLVSMGNPHAVCFVDDPDAAPLREDGPVLEADPVFPRKANIEFVRVQDRAHAVMRVWERGTGETLACGTGACAAMVACALNGLTGREAEMSLPGGKLLVHWDETDGRVYMTGPATFVYDGEWLGEL